MYIPFHSKTFLTMLFKEKGEKMCKAFFGKVAFFGEIKKKKMVEDKQGYFFPFHAIEYNMRPYYAKLKPENVFIEIYYGEYPPTPEIQKILIARAAHLREFMVERLQYQFERTGTKIAPVLTQLLPQFADQIEEHNQQVEIAQLQREKERVQRQIDAAQQTLQEKRQRIEKAKDKFLAGEYISNDDFLELCDHYKIELPPKTRGWAKKSLSEIRKTSYTYRGNPSTKIISIANDLFLRILGV